MQPNKRSLPRTQRGLSLVEMMVGVTVGLFVVAAAGTLMVSQLGENRRLLVETQLQQDLRATADLVTRDLRRSGYNVNTVDDSFAGIWLPDRPTSLPVANDRAPMTLTPRGAIPARYDYLYTRQNERIFQFSLTADGTIYRRINIAPAQPMTDRTTLNVTEFTVEEEVMQRPENQRPPPITLACNRLCDNGTQDCWPTLGVRDLLITIEGHAVSDPSVVRRIESRVRVRNDAIDFNAGGEVCP